MTPEAQRIAIAEACGTHMVHVMPFEGGTLTSITDKNGRIRLIRQMGEGPRTETYPTDWIPPLDYLRDLNAMHEAEKTLPDLNLYRRFLHLVAIEDPANKGNEPAFATAAQRAEAFLRTLGRWEDTP